MKIKSSGGGSRLPSFPGRFVIQSWRGKIHAQAWPRKRGPNIPEKTKAQNQRFAIAQRNIKHMPFAQLEMARRLTDGTPLLPRDLLTKAQFGRMNMIIVTDTNRYYPMAALKDLSTFLDVTSPQTGSMLVRGDDLWYALPAPASGDVLGVDGATMLPAWVEGGGGGGGALSLIATYAPDPGTQTNIDFPLPDIAGLYKLMLSGTAGAANTYLNAIFSIDGGVTYKNASGDYKSHTSGSAASIALTTSGKLGAGRPYAAEMLLSLVPTDDYFALIGSAFYVQSSGSAENPTIGGTKNGSWGGNPNAVRLQSTVTGGMGNVTCSLYRLAS